MLSLFKPLCTKNEFEDWIKICFNLGQASFVAFPVILFGSYSFTFKALSLRGLMLSVYLFWTSARRMRNYIDNLN